MDDNDKETYAKFKKVVNLRASELEEFLNTQNSKSVYNLFDTVYLGHLAGKHTIDILRKPKTEFTAEDYTHMEDVCSYVDRHTAHGGPDKNRGNSHWRYSLMNYGHDPLK